MISVTDAATRSPAARKPVILGTLLLSFASACVAASQQGQGGGLGDAMLPANELPGAGGYAVGTVRIEVDVAPGRRLPVQIWYPADESARALADAGRPVVDFEPEGTANRKTLNELTRNAPAAYTQRTMHAADSAPVRAQQERFPLILMSHCTDCVRFAYFSLSEHLASKGYVVVSPDHVDNTIYNYVAGNSVGLELDDFLERRRLDIYALTDLMLDAQAMVVPDGLRGRIDGDRIGMVGHSFGALTTGYSSTRDVRIKAVVSLAMLLSVENNLPYTGPELAMKVQLQPLSKPVLLVNAEEDVMQIIGLGNTIRQNFLDSTAEAWFASIADTGHYSVMDICGIMNEYTNGCGEGIRATQFLQAFTYLDVATTTRLVREMVGRFFDRTILGVAAANPQEVAFDAADVLKVEHRTP
jgi:predicted dienelactone hydrolase